MRRIVAIIIMTACTALAVQAQSYQIGATAKATLLTCGAGDDFYTTFGHSALRITDTASGVDYVYNYGTFNFGEPHFYWHFTRGQLNYMLSRVTYESFLNTYRYEQRAVWEQELQLSPQEVSNLYCALEWNHEPENKYYKYDFFRDNCATRVRDMIEAASGKHAIALPEGEGISYRQYLHRAMRDTLEWWAMGIDLLLGLPADHRCTASEAMFYPLVMMDEYAEARREGEPVVGERRKILDDTRMPMARSFPPTVVFGIVMLVVAVCTLMHKKIKVPVAVDRTLFGLAAAVGLFLIFMWVGTDHWCTKLNLNILWASPLYIFFAVYMKNSPRWAVWLQLAMLAAAAVYTVVCGLSMAILMIVIILACRTTMLLRR